MTLSNVFKGTPLEGLKVELADPTPEEAQESCGVAAEWKDGFDLNAVPGSKRGFKCTGCEKEVILSPSGQDLMTKGMKWFCITCFLGLLNNSDTPIAKPVGISITSGAERELEEYKKAHE